MGKTTASWRILLVTPSLIPKTDLLPAKVTFDLGNCSRARHTQRQQHSCHQSAKGSFGLASYDITSFQIQTFSGTVPKCLKKCLSSSPETRVPLSCTAENKFLQGCNNQLRDVKQLLLYPYKWNSSNAINNPLSSTVEFAETICCTLPPSPNFSTILISLF